MLEAISWKEYLMGTGIVALGYYAVVIFIYYKNFLPTFLPLHFFVYTPPYAWRPPLEFLFQVINFLFLKRKFFFFL